jgi:hypothetical protein
MLLLCDACCLQRGARRTQTYHLGLIGIVILSGSYRWPFRISFCITAVCAALAEFPARLKWKSERSLLRRITVKNKNFSQFLNNVQKDLVRFTEVNVTLLFSMLAGIAYSI